jgi:hypothetical protein
VNGKRIVGLLLAIYLSACSSNEVSPSTVALESVTVPTTTSTTVLASTTSLIGAATPIDICPRGLVWDPGTTYFADCFIFPIAFQTDEPGWRSFGGSVQVVRAELWGEHGGLVGVQLLGYESTLSPENVLELILAIDGVETVTAPAVATIASWSGVTADVRTAPDPQPARSDGSTADCSSPRYALRWFFDAWPGYPLLLAFPDEFGLGACYRFRVWVLDVDGVSITITAVVFDPDRFEERVGAAEELLASLSLAP